MNLDKFIESAKYISARNVDERVSCVTAQFDNNANKMTLIYFVISPPTDSDWENCELMCAEMLAEFPDIETAETECRQGHTVPTEFEANIVYSV